MLVTTARGGQAQDLRPLLSWANPSLQYLAQPYATQSAGAAWRRVGDDTDSEHVVKGPFRTA